jgi:hypothetical protein
LNNDTTLMGKSIKTVMKIEGDSERQMMVSENCKKGHTKERLLQQMFAGILGLGERGRKEGYRDTGRGRGI